MDIRSSIIEIRKRIEAAAERAGRRGGDVTVAAATKYAAADIIESLSEYNIFIAGENRAQDFLEKYALVRNPKIEWHFIGRLQTNKVKYIVDKVKLIHSLDRLALAEEIERQCALKNIPRMDALIEVNAGGEEQKGGIRPDGVFAFYESLKAFKHIKVRGLMTVMPVLTDNTEKSRNLYLQMKGIYDILKDKDKNVDILSMGMSDDFETAIEYGATLIRLGRILFK